MFEISQKSYIMSDRSLMVIEPTDNCLDHIIAIAKAADVVLYAGSSGRSLYLELPDDYDDILAMFALAEEAGLTCWEQMDDPYDPPNIDWG